jgi:hypothetical protein
VKILEGYYLINVQTPTKYVNIKNEKETVTEICVALVTIRK